MSVKDYEAFTGKKMNFIQHFALKINEKRFEKKPVMAEVFRLILTSPVLL